MLVGIDLGICVWEVRQIVKPRMLPAITEKLIGSLAELQLTQYIFSVGVIYVKDLMVLVLIIDIGIFRLRGETVNHTMHAHGYTE